MKLERMSAFESMGQTIEMGEISNETVFKKYWVSYGKSLNEIIIDEYKIKSPDGRPDSPSRLVGNLRLHFSEGDIDEVEVRTDSVWISNF